MSCIANENDTVHLNECLNFSSSKNWKMSGVSFQSGDPEFFNAHSTPKSLAKQYLQPTSIPNSVPITVDCKFLFKNWGVVLIGFEGFRNRKVLRVNSIPITIDCKFLVENSGVVVLIDYEGFWSRFTEPKRRLLMVNSIPLTANLFSRIGFWFLLLLLLSIVECFEVETHNPNWVNSILIAVDCKFLFDSWVEVFFFLFFCFW